ncbi:biotin transporter BioY [Lactiplantibacillus fabifermentans]|uniref:Biotin transporter n=2 Tax=Lactiplantibacillus fabifermentans TaxID=483011 RepID=A0A0R2NTK5_9LACO|nr:biotin transporter BioY [Lactiplantibacillus fabifermentans]ETY75089.1 biotin transporter [Lactiplantibacillus fabifermentans T30PCM01]KRO28716.1 BioY family protein [Lactiplantibacillus fabifermentans DSM 21115]
MDNTRPLSRLIIAAELAVGLAICSKITIPIGLVPLTGQTLAVGLIASIVPAMVGTWAIGIYLLLGLIGIPVFASSAAGLAALFGPTGGYLWGFFLYVWLVAAMRRSLPKMSALIVGNLLGATVQLLAGAAWLVVSAHQTWAVALNTGVLPFLLPGLIKVVLVVITARAVLKRLPARFKLSGWQ